MWQADDKNSLLVWCKMCVERHVFCREYALLLNQPDNLTIVIMLFTSHGTVYFCFLA